MAPFINGLDLCEAFFNEIARLILDDRFPSLQYSAALIGYGSDTIGFDDQMSTDHMWGPRFLLFLGENDLHLREEIAETFSVSLPSEYKGYPVNFSAPDWTDGGVRVPEPISEGSVNPLVEYHTLKSFFMEELNYDPLDIPTIPQWLSFSEHRLLSLTSGRVFHDDLGLAAIRRSLAYYPHEVWLWMLASQWRSIGGEEAFVGRCGYVGDDLGSRLVAARQVQRIMRLCFLMARRYAPYSKWFGTAFARLPIASKLLPYLQATLAAPDWTGREESLSQAYSIVAAEHNALAITAPLDTAVHPFFGRPFRVLSVDRFAAAIKEMITDPLIMQLPLIGTVSQFTESVAVNDDVGLLGKLRGIYR